MAAECLSTMAITTAVALLGPPGLPAGLWLLPSLAIAAFTLVTCWEHPPRCWLLGASALAGGVTMIWSALGPQPIGSAQGLAITAGIWISYLPRHRWWAVAASVAIVAACAALAFLDPTDHLMRYLNVSLVLTAMWVAIIVYTHEHWHLIGRLERAKDAEREIALGGERHRFAADLHDIQGHTLYVIKLKAAVGARLLDTDPERTRRELADIQQLVARTIEEGRRLAASTHTLVLSAELANAVALFDAAGIATQVDQAAPGGEAIERDTFPSASGSTYLRAGPHDAILALVLREATTNVLRHAAPSRVWISCDTTAIAIANDGVLVADDVASAAPRHGLATLSDRVAAAGGELEVSCVAGRFGVTARFSSGVAT